MYRTKETHATVYNLAVQPAEVLYQRGFASEYDELGQVKTRGVTSDEWGFEETRGFRYTYDWAAGQVKRVGPDGAETTVYLDAANRVSRVLRQHPVGFPMLQADYIYYDNAQLRHVLYLNAAGVWYEYDGANRVTQIDHKNSEEVSMLKLKYTYDRRDLPTTVRESGLGLADTATWFFYDNRGRLISEVRIETGAPAEVIYNLRYEYDPGGNRIGKVDLENDREIVYHYDVKLDQNGDPNPYESENNRLMYYEVIEPIAGSVQSTTRYYYCSNSSDSKCGNVTRVVTNPEGTTDYSSTRLVYASNGSAVAYVTGETWDGTDPENTYAITYAREFRYDGARARYLVRKLDREALLFDPPEFNGVEDGDVWWDYDGDRIYGDFTSDGVTFTETRSHEVEVDPVTGRSTSCTCGRCRTGIGRCGRR